MKRLLVLVALAIILTAGSAWTWDGYDYEKGAYVEIESGNLVRAGEDIEVYDYSTGDYHDMSVESIERSGSTVEIEAYDYETGESRILEMED